MLARVVAHAVDSAPLVAPQASKGTRYTIAMWLPALASALLAAGFDANETRMILGENYRRVFEASVG